MASSKPWRLLCFFCCLSISTVQVWAEPGTGYPFVSAVKGPASKVDAKGTKIKLKEKVQLFSGTKLITEAGAKIVVDLSETSVLILDSNTELAIPTVDIETGRAEKLNLLQGRVGIRCQQNCGFAVVSEISLNSLTPGEFIFEYDKEKVYFWWKVLSGELEAKGLNQEEGIALKPKMKAGFQALVTDGKVLFDDLLKGKRVVRGEKPIQQMIGDEEHLASVELFKLKKAIVREKTNQLKKKKQKSICEKPYGEFGQCLFKLQGQDCYKFICNANGEWANPLPLPKDEKKCNRAALVGQCE